MLDFLRPFWAFFCNERSLIIVKKRRKKINQKRARKLFTNTADKTRALNLRAVPMRGGFRI